MELLLKSINMKYQVGQSLIELLFAIAFAAILIPALLVGIVASREGKPQQRQRIEGVNFLKEAQDATRSVRERGWTTFAVNGTYHPVISGSQWTLVSGLETVNGFTRSVVISDVYRDAQGAIVTTGGTLDPSTKKIVTTVSWNQPYASSIDSTLYLTRYLENAAYTETTQAHFNAGIKTGVTVQATSGSSIPDDGEIILGAGGNSDWCTPNLLSQGLDLPGQGYPNAITAIEGKAFAGTGENASGLSFMQINITNTQPPSGSFNGTFDGHKTNDVFGETNYGYISTDTNGKEVVIITIASQPFTEVGYFNAPGNSSGRGLFVLSNVGYVTVGNKLYTFDLSSKTGSRPILDPDGVTLSGNGSQVYVVGNYAYVSIAGAGTELQIINVSNPSNLQIVGSSDVNGQAATDLFVDASGNRAYLATDVSASQREMFIIDVSTKTGSRPTVGSYEANGMNPKGITVVPGNRAILVGLNGEEYQVINISNDSNPIRCGGAQVDAGVNGVASVLESDGDAYSYISTSDTSSEFQIIEGGPGGSYASSGVFESQTFNPGYQTSNNRFEATFSEPAGTNIQFQVSLASLVSSSCPSTGGYTFIGPDGTTSTYFNPASGESAVFPFINYLTYTNPGQCFRYKVYFSTTNQNSTPVLNNVTINYSP